MARGEILIVEDEFIIAEMMKETLQAAGYGCAHAASLDAALDAVAARSWAGAVLDIKLQHQLVFPVAEALRVRAVPFAFSSGLGDAADLPAHFQDVPVLRKPWGEGDLEDIARAIFGAQD
jgi:DNA-binding response OmpR family regulator